MSSSAPRPPAVGPALAFAAALAMLVAPAAAQDPRAAEEAWQAGDRARAEQLYAEILRADSADYTALHRMALLHAWAERYDQSLALFDRMLRLYPEATDARIDRARVLAWRGDLDRAVGALEEVLRSEPDNVHARVNLARTLRWQARYREAAEHARRALAADPTSGEAREELGAARLGFAPSASPTLAHEADSDGNRMTTAWAVARFRPVSALAVRVDVYARDARQLGPADLSHTTGGGTVTGQLEVAGGWGLAATLGASAADAGHPVAPAWAAAVATPHREDGRASLTLRRQAFDATARLIENGIEMMELALEGGARLGERAELSFAGAVAWLDARSSGEENQRWAGDVSGSYRLASTFTLGVAARGFGYERDLNDGYFDPDFLGLAELLGRLRQPVGPVELSLEGAPGLQRVGGAGEIGPVGRVAASATWPLAPGREVVVGVVFANGGLTRLAEAEDTEYRYRALTGRLVWTF